MDLKAVLGDAYKEGMTFEEMAAALAEVPGPDEYARLKKATDAATHEAAEYKRSLRKKQTDEEAAEAERQKKLDDLTKEIEQLRAEKLTAGYKAKFLALGFTEDAAAKAAKAQVEGNMDAVFGMLQARQQDVVKEAKKQSVMGSDKRPSAGQGTAEGTVDYRKAYDEAVKNGDGPAAAYYMRVIQQMESAQD